MPLETLQQVAKAFGDARPGLAVGSGVAVTGSQATALQVAVNLLNAAAGNVGKTVRFGPDQAYGQVTPYADVAKLVQAMAAGEIEVLVLGTAVNPAFTLPGGLKVADAIRKVPFVVSFANLPDETTALAHLVLPDTHWLESWGDYSPHEGVFGPDAADHEAHPRRSRRSATCCWRSAAPRSAREEGKGPLPWATFEQFLKAAWEPTVKGQWEAALQQGGVWRDVAAAAVAVTPKLERVEAAAAKLEGPGDGLALLPYPSLRFYDGRERDAGLAAGSAGPDDAGRRGMPGWRSTPQTAARLGIRQGDVVKVTSPHGAIEVPRVPVGLDPSRRRGHPDRPSLRALPRPDEVRAGAPGDQSDGAAAGGGRRRLGRARLRVGQGDAGQDGGAAAAGDPAGHARSG